MILSIDTSTKKIVLSLAGEGLSVYRSYIGKERHAVRLAVEVENLLRDYGITLKDIEIFGLGIGPGTLTGLRIGIGYVLGVCSVTGAKIVPVNSLMIVSGSITWDGEVVVLRKARSGFVYYQTFVERIRSLEGPSVLSIEEARKRISTYENPILVGDGKEYFEGRKAPDELDFPLPEVLMEMTLSMLNEAVSYTEVKPLYIQKSIAELNLERRLEK